MTGRVSGQRAVGAVLLSRAAIRHGPVTGVVGRGKVPRWMRECRQARRHVTGRQPGRYLLPLLQPARLYTPTPLLPSTATPPLSHPSPPRVALAVPDAVLPSRGVPN